MSHRKWTFGSYLQDSTCTTSKTLSPRHPFSKSHLKCGPTNKEYPRKTTTRGEENRSSNTGKRERDILRDNHRYPEHQQCIRVHLGLRRRLPPPGHNCRAPSTWKGHPGEPSPSCCLNLTHHAHMFEVLCSAQISWPGTCTHKNTLLWSTPVRQGRPLRAERQKAKVSPQPATIFPASVGHLWRTPLPKTNLGSCKAEVGKLFFCQGPFGYIYNIMNQPYKIINQKSSLLLNFKSHLQLLWCVQIFLSPASHLLSLLGLLWSLREAPARLLLAAFSQNPPPDRRKMALALHSCAHT